MALEAIHDALKKIAPNVTSSNSIENESSTDVQDAFCFEDTFETKGLKLTVKDVGETPLPLKEDFIKKIINVSSKAKFGKGETTVLDINVRDTQIIPASNLTVEIDTDCLENLLTRAKSGLSITQKCTLVPHLHNMLVYGPGQFFKMHRDSEKVPNMVATLVIVLPSFHKGGDLVIQHGNSKHVFFGSTNTNLSKCIIFYSDCLHEILPVIEGYRVAITYNVVLNPSDDITDVQVNDALDDAVKDYFSSETKYGKPKRLVYALNHSYSENNLKWGLLKGEDRKCAFALLAVAKKQNLIPCLALGRFRQLFDVGREDVPVDEDTALYHWVDEWNAKFLEEVVISKNQLCSFLKTQDIFEPFDTEETGFTGNEGNTVEHWYRRGFVALWSNKWDFSRGYKECLIELHRSILTAKEGKTAISIEEIKEMKSKIIKVKYWKDCEVIKCLFDIVVHLNDKEMAIAILSNLTLDQMLQTDKIDWILKLEDQFDDETWLEVLNHWSKGSYGMTFEVPSFLKEYLKHPSRKPDSLTIKHLSEKHVQGGTFFMSSRKKDCQYLFDIVVFLNDQEIAVSMLSKLPEQIIQLDRIDWVLKLEDQFDDQTWSKILENWTKQNRGIGEYRLIKESCKTIPLFIEQYLKHPSRKPGSLIVKHLAEKHVHQFMEIKKDSETHYSLNYSYDDQRHRGKAKSLCSAFKSCFVLENAILENELIHHVADNPNTFQPKTLYYLLLSLKDELNPEQLLPYKCLRDGATESLEKKIAQSAKENFWEISEYVSCPKNRCETCPLIQTFLYSKNTQRYCLSANANVRKHTSIVLKTFVQTHSLVISTDNCQKPPTLVIEKDKRVFEKNKSKADELETLKTHLQKIPFQGEARTSEVPEPCSKTSSAIHEDGNKETPVKSEENILDEQLKGSGSPSAKRMKSE